MENEKQVTKRKSSKASTSAGSARKKPAAKTARAAKKKTSSASASATPKMGRNPFGSSATSRSSAPSGAWAAGPARPVVTPEKASKSEAPEAAQAKPAPVQQQTEFELHEAGPRPESGANTPGRTTERMASWLLVDVPAEAVVLGLKVWMFARRASRLRNA